MTEPPCDLLERYLVLGVEHAKNPHSSIHGVDHWRRVGDKGVELAAATPGADERVVAAFAGLHDSQRLSEGRDPDHGARAAALATRLPLGLDANQSATLEAALIDHDRGLIADDPTIGVCWDADRLDLTRLGVTPNPRLLSTAAARERA